ncbi:MAG: acyl-CoA ligase (AMP-forming), exosortase A system-associated [Gammaproteobacteria bacterium]
MSGLLHELALASAERAGDAPAVMHRGVAMRYGELAQALHGFAGALLRLGLQRQDRVAVFLPKQREAVVAMFGTTLAGGAFVPVNPLLKAAQVRHILRDCNVRVLVTSGERVSALAQTLDDCPDLRHLVLVGDAGASAAPANRLPMTPWTEMAGGTPVPARRSIDTDMAAIFYTSGSTGLPKGVVLSHRNMVSGAESVAHYLGNHGDDRLLAVLPFSFDYGFSQLSTAFLAGASVALLEYLFPRDVIAAVAREGITGLAGVPPLWSQLADLPWPQEGKVSLRYITNSGGTMPAATLAKLRSALPRTRVFLMYGLTEAFRSTYLAPEEIDRRPGSIGKAIPNAEVVVVRPDGTPCEPDEEGELVHRGALVSLGYWNDPEKTAARFRPAPGRPGGIVVAETAVWSGDTVRADKDGFLYFVGRRDEMIKTSGYRVSPTEVEEVAFASGLVADAAAVGVPHPALGQAIVLVAAAPDGRPADEQALLDTMRRELPAFMVPAAVVWRAMLPRNPNGKYDRAGLAAELRALFAEASA